MQRLAKTWFGWGGFDVFKMFVGTVWEEYKNMASMPSQTTVSHKMYIKVKCQDVGKDKGRFSFCL